MSQLPHSYIIAEAGVNHNGSLDMALKLIDAAVYAGADSVKFQTFKAEKLVSKTAPKADYQTKTTAQEESQFEMIKKLELSESDHHVLTEYCRQKEIDFLSTPFDLDSVDLLSTTLGVPLLKISSGDLTNAPLLLKAARTQKPIIISTGMADLGEIETALGVLAFGYSMPVDATPSLAAFKEAYSRTDSLSVLQDKVTLLHCTTEYPAPVDEVNLKVIKSLRQAFGLPVGFSDHTEGIAIPTAAVALGATVIEKHFTLDRTLPGPDHRASLEPEQLKAMISSIRQVESALGSARKVPVLSELKNKSIARKSVLASTKISKGEVFTEANLTVKRPGNGVSPFYYWDLLGQMASRDYEEEEVIIL